MADEIPAVEPDKIDYSLKFLLKKLGWNLAFWETALKLGPALSPAAVAMIEKISNYTSSYGITLHIDKPVFDGMLPVFILVSLISGHDFAKVKYSDNSTVSKIL